MKHPHLVGSCVAVTLTVIFLTFIKCSALNFERREAQRDAGHIFDSKLQGSALQRLAFETDNLLPVYGSSELGEKYINNPGGFFEAAPTGFKTFVVGKGGTTPLIMMQDLAALGKSIEGRKVVFILSPGWFSAPLSPSNYAGNYSPLHANALIFCTSNEELKIAAAKRMSQFPDTLAHDYLLNLAVQSLSKGNHLLYQWILPLGKLNTAFLRLMDDLGSTETYEENRILFHNPTRKKQGSPHWEWLLSKAEQENPGLIENPPLPPAENEKAPGSTLLDFNNSETWGDLDLLLKLVTAAKARPLVLSIPLAGAHYDEHGQTIAIRSVYYDRLKQMAETYHVPLFTFQEHEYDDGFLIEHRSHLTPKGWLYFDKIIDDFYHDKIQ